jgi:L,D-peptidoglycan transpeptidase YkuD (ErfK/YbiS/YcfS/YnhG family)
MTIFIKNKHTLQIDDFKFKCCIGIKGSTKYKREGDKKTPKGVFSIENIYYRKDRKKKPITPINCVAIRSNMGWCNDSRFPKIYNKLFDIKKKIKHEKLLRKDYKYDYILPIKYNFKKPVPKLGSCIFIHLTKNFKPTAGCIALKEKDFLILIRIINKSTKIKIY